MICSACLAEGRPLYGPRSITDVRLAEPTVDHPTEPGERPAGAAITVRDGTALCAEHL